MSHRRDHYEVLGVTSSATQAQVRAAYRRLAREWHPDAKPDAPDAERRFKAIGRAYETLGDPDRREAYDRRRSRGALTGPGEGRRQSYAVDEGPLYHEDLGHHSDFYQAGDPLSVADAAALTGRGPDLVRRHIRAGRLPATRAGRTYLLRRRDVERWDRLTAAARVVRADVRSRS
jgi:excisionase family DNA binding protein